MKNCETCKFWCGRATLKKIPSANTACCKRFPPSIPSDLKDRWDYDPWGNFPITSKINWCGEWKKAK